MCFLRHQLTDCDFLPGGSSGYGASGGGYGASGGYGSQGQAAYGGGKLLNLFVWENIR